MECREWPGTLLCCVANNGDGDWRTMEKRNKSEEGEKEQVARSGARGKTMHGETSSRRSGVRRETGNLHFNGQF